MKYNPDIHHRRSIRLTGFDYSKDGAYFVTVCARNRECIFGEVVNGLMRSNPFGIIVKACWDNLPYHYPNVELDTFVVMPNHIHGIVIMTGGVGAGSPRPYKKWTLGQIMAYFKYQSTKRINEGRDSPGSAIWQRNYYEHIIRNEDELNRIRQYIGDNPLNWDADEENPNRKAAVVPDIRFDDLYN